MNDKKAGCALILAFLIAGCASTPDTVEVVTMPDPTIQAVEPVQQTDTDTLKASGDEDPDEVICKRMRKLGTRVRSTVCATRAEWEGVAEHGQGVTKDMQRRPQQGREEG